MLVKELYTIQSVDHIEGTIVGRITLNPAHDIYKGHFPHQPVLPGVCMMQIVAELTQKGLNSEKAIKIKRAGQAKFLIPIIPDKNPQLTVTIKVKDSDTEEIKVTALISEGEQIFFKFKGTLS